MGQLHLWGIWGLVNENSGRRKMCDDRADIEHDPEGSEAQVFTARVGAERCE